MPLRTSISSRLPPEIADEAVGVMDAGDNADGSEFRLLVAEQHLVGTSRMRSAWAMKSGPFSASRTAAVAMASILLTPI